MKKLLFLTLVGAFALGACSPFVITGSSGQQPEVIIETEAVGEPASVSLDIMPTVGY